MSKQSNEYEIVEFMMDKFKLESGIGEPKHRPPVRRYKHETQKYDMGGTGGDVSDCTELSNYCILILKF